MDIYLPIAEVSVNALLILGMGGLVGFLSGLFGVGGGFLMTPLLIFIGIPPAVAVGTQANQLVAASVSGMLAHLRRGAAGLDGVVEGDCRRAHRAAAVRSRGVTRIVRMSATRLNTITKKALTSSHPRTTLVSSWPSPCCEVRSCRRSDRGCPR